jgi:hypothetical protein
MQISYLEVISEAIAAAHYIKIAPYVHVVEQPRTRDLLLADARARFSIFNSSMVSHLVQDYLVDVWKYVLIQELCLVILQALLILLFADNYRCIKTHC